MDPNRDVKMVQVALGSEVGPLIAGQAKVAVMYLEREFPNEYPDYKRRTKALIPFLW